MSSNSRITRTVYKTLLNLAKKFDDNPEAKCLLFRKDYSFNTAPINQSNISTHKSAAGVYFKTVLDSLFSGGIFMIPTDRPLRHFIQEEFRKKYAEYSTSTRIEVCLHSIRKLSSIWTNFNDYTNAAIYLNRAKSKGSQMNPTDIHSSQITFPLSSSVCLSDTQKIFPGLLLAAHPMVSGHNARSIILVLQHDERMTYGLVINKPIEVSQLYQYIDDLA